MTTVAGFELILRGGMSAAALIAGFFFFRFWRSSRDRLFVSFSVAFWLLSLDALALVVVHWEAETQHHPFFVRLLAFVLLLVGIIDKNRRARTPPK